MDATGRGAPNEPDTQQPIMITITIMIMIMSRIGIGKSHDPCRDESHPGLAYDDIPSRTLPRVMVESLALCALGQAWLTNNFLDGDISDEAGA